MSSRYHTSIKIGKGVKVNLSKSGPSLTLGKRGASVNVSGKGVRVNGKVPGTDISYSHTVGGKTTYRQSHSRSSQPSYGEPMPPMGAQLPRGGQSHRTTSQPPRAAQPSRSSSQQMPLPAFIVCMNDKGQTWIEDERGREITDTSLVRRIKAHPDYQRQKENLEYQRQEHISEVLQISEEENEKFLNIHTFSPVVDSEKEFQKELKSIKLVKYSREIFNEKVPEKEEIISALEAEAEANVGGMFWNRGRLKAEYVEKNYPDRMAAALEAYESRKAAFEAEQDKLEAEKNAAAQEEYEEQKEYLTLLIDGDPEVVPEAITDWISSCQLPVEISIDFDWDPENGIIYLDVDLPEIEDLPETQMVQLDSGNVKEKNKTQKQLREEYAQLVFGLGVFITTSVFNISPAIEKILISGYTQRRDKEGEMQNDYIYSLKFFRETLEKQDVTGMDPAEVCMSAENRCNQTTTGLFKTIKPYDIF